MTGKEIATKLSLSEQTVKNSVHRILDKIGVGGRLGEIEAYQPRRWVCSSAENTVTKKMSAQLSFGALPRRAPCLIDGRNARVYRGLQGCECRRRHAVAQSELAADVAFTAGALLPGLGTSAADAWPFINRNMALASAVRNSRLKRLKSTSSGLS
jgi:Bacterial regulatory proteins, luxR family